MKKDKVVLYMHAGSGNHGCEAIVNSLCKFLPAPAILVTHRKEEDEKYSLNNLCSEIVQERSINQNFFVHAWYYAIRKIFHDPESFLRYRYRQVIGKNAHALNISIGGDNYCYDNMVSDLKLANSMFHHQGCSTVLLGCSVEPERLKDKTIVEDLKRYDAIMARESITYQALKEAGICENVYLYPDTAFLLDKEELPLPEGFEEGNTIGLNISPMIVAEEKKNGITMRNYEALIQHILDTTDMKIALIPHVIWKQNDDREPIQKLYEKFSHTGRVIKIEDATAPQLKGYIGRCRMFIGARTHATIAAYSSCVPTLVVGYSVKALGIAKDLFGTSENYVLPVQKLENREDLLQAFEWLKKEEENMRSHLHKVMPEYQEKVRDIAGTLQEIWDKLS